MSSPQPEGPVVSKALAEAWQRSIPGDAEVARAYARFLARRARPRLPARLVVLWLVTGMLMGMGTLYAAGAVPRSLFGASAPPRVAAAPVASAPTARAAAASRASAMPSAVQSTPATPGAAASSARSVAARELVRQAATAESWQRVAQGLRESDLGASDEALLKLSRQGSSADRETAKLVRAQVLMRVGRAAEARALLVELSDGATLATTRSKAAFLLSQLSLAASSHRSFEPPPDTKLP
jgi:hypothetical protein